MKKTTLLLSIIVCLSCWFEYIEAVCECGYRTSTGDVWRQAINLDFTGGNATAKAKQYFIPQTWSSPATSTKKAKQNVAANIYDSNGGLGFKTSAYSGSGPVLVAEMDSIDATFLYGSFRMRSTVPSVSGVCFSQFLFQSNTAEIDIEFLSHDPQYYNTVHYSNQPTLDSNGNTIPGTTVTDSYPGVDYTAFHNHRIDWVPSQTRFYVDDNLRQTLSKNVPKVAMTWIVNLWSDGDPGWTYGPPTADATATVYFLRAYYNSTKITDAQFNTACVNAGRPAVCNV